MSNRDARPPAALSPHVFAQLVEEAPIGVYLVQDGAVVYGNRWLRELSGYDTVCDQPLKALETIHPDDRALVARQMDLRLAGKKAQPSYQVRLLLRDGQVRNVELFAKTVLHRGRPAIQGMVIDVTDVVDVERCLCESVARMEESNRRSRLFIDILSHDLMNPVWVAENYLVLLTDDDVPESGRPLYEGIRSALAKARGILADARTYLRIKELAGAARERVNLGTLVEETAQGLRALWEKKGQQIGFSLDAAAELDAGPLLRDVVLQLLSNAIKYAPQGSPIEVAVRAGPRVRLEVRDRGPGVSAEERTRIFERFERMEKGAISGVGLGLSIVRRIVELYGGQVWAEENPGGGSVFVAEFPVGDFGQPPEYPGAQVGV